MDPFPRELQPPPHHVLLMHQRLRLPSAWAPPTTATAATTARRCLFGVADPVDTKAALDRIIHEETERCIRKWDFDPLSGKPVENPRRFLWMLPREELSPPAAEPAPLPGKREEGRPAAAVRPRAEGDPGRRARKYAPYQQTLITDYWGKKKCGGKANAKLEASSVAGQLRETAGAEGTAGGQ